MHGDIEEGRSVFLSSVSFGRTQGRWIGLRREITLDHPYFRIRRELAGSLHRGMMRDDPYSFSSPCEERRIAELVRDYPYYYSHFVFVSFRGAQDR